MGIWQNPGAGEFDRVRLSRIIKDSVKSLPDFHGNLFKIEADGVSTYKMDFDTTGWVWEDEPRHL